MEDLEENCQESLPRERWHPLLCDCTEVMDSLVEGRIEAFDEMCREVELCSDTLDIMDRMDVKLDQAKGRVASLEDQLSQREVEVNRQKMTVLTLAHMVEKQKTERAVVEQRVKSLEGENQRLQSQLRELQKISKEQTHINRKMALSIVELKSDQRGCPICMEQKPFCALACGHTGCQGCLALLKHCHICREPTHGSVIKLYLL